MRITYLPGILFLSFFSLISCIGQDSTAQKLTFITDRDVLVGAQRTESWFPLITGKKIGLVANQTSMIGDVHLADSLISAGFDLVKVFGPEHGFRGEAEYGKELNDGRDDRTGLPVISLYGKNKKPLKEDLQGLDVLLYDIQDVGVRFFTYISTLSYTMEACAENNIPLILLDRPNPNGFYVDGPVLDTHFRSFVGLHPIPVVYGMTAGEYARMVNEEGWLAGGVKCRLIVIAVDGYDHSMIYKLPVKPSPNLPDWQSVYLYPSLCLFEGTMMSVGRGTDMPFRIFGHPRYLIGSFTFTPRSIPGVAEHPPFEGQVCYGSDVSGFAEEISGNAVHFNLTYLMNAYKVFPDTETFFNSYFDKLSGTGSLRKQISEGWDENSIRGSWQPGLDDFREIRKKYLLYPDFE